MRPIAVAAARAAIVLSVFALGASAVLAPTQPPRAYREIFAEIHARVAEQFVDPTFGGLDWHAIGEQCADRAGAAPDDEAFASIINEMLALLKTSHTHLYTAREPAYFQLLSIFKSPLQEPIAAAHPDNPDLRYPGIGAFTRVIAGEVFITGVLERSPAHYAGLRVGDRIISVHGQPFHAIGSFEHRVEQPTEIRVQRHAMEPEGLTLTVTPRLLDPADVMLSAVKASVRVIERNGRRIGLIHMWSMAGQPYREALLDAIASPVLRDADALVLDFRDGWGGANPEDLNIFHQRVPVMTHITREGEERVIDYQWRKPVALLVNEGSRSGKEIFAFGFKKHRIGPVVGSTTAGAVVGGRPILIRPGLLLYIAVADVRADGERLEGKGVTPDIAVPFDVRYANGADPQLDAAVEALCDDHP